MTRSRSPVPEVKDSSQSPSIESSSSTIFNVSDNGSNISCSRGISRQSTRELLRKRDDTFDYTLKDDSEDGNFYSPQVNNSSEEV